MARKQTLGGKAPQTGNRVSHSHICTRHQWMPNIQTKALFSEALGRSVRVTIPTSVIRTVDKVGGLDLFLLRTPDEALSGTMRRIKAQVAAKVAS